MLLHEKYMSKCLPWCSPQGIFCYCCNRSKAESSEDPEGAVEPKKNMLEDFYGGAYADFVLSNKRKIVALFGVLLLASTYTWTQMLEPATKPFTFFADNHFYSQTLSKMQTKFAYESADGKIMLQLSFGLDP